MRTLLALSASVATASCTFLLQLSLQLSVAVLVTVAAVSVSCSCVLQLCLATVSCNCVLQLFGCFLQPLQLLLQVYLATAFYDCCVNCCWLHFHLLQLFARGLPATVAAAAFACTSVIVCGLQYFGTRLFEASLPLKHGQDI